MNEAAVVLVEVSPRDGLQNEQARLTTEDKGRLVELVAAAGIRRVEATSFVHPERVPTMADAEAVMARLATVPVRAGALVVNLRGVQRAIAAGTPEVNAVVVCTEELSRRNQGMDVDTAVATWGQIAQSAREAGLLATVTLAAAFGCPFEGEVSVTRVAAIAERVVATARPDELSLADTIGVAVPNDVTARVAAVRSATDGDVTLRCHFHDTRGTGVANALAAVDAGVRILDGSLGGLGGCPFAPGATGNVATEDLVYALGRSGFSTGLDLERLREAARWLESRVGRPLPSNVLRAGGFGAVVSDR